MFVNSGFIVNEHEMNITIDDAMRSFVPQELESEWTNGGIRPTEAGLERMDYILPRLLLSNKE